MSNEELNNEELGAMTKGDIIYWARCIPQTGTFDLIELKIRTVQPTYFVGVDDKTSQAYPFAPKDIGEIVFYDRENALREVKAAEAEFKGQKFTKQYEEY